MTQHPNRFGAGWRTRALAVVLAVTALLVGVATVAEAHDVLVSTSPADGSTVAVVPASVRLTFDAPALAIGTGIIVTGPAGQVQSGAAVLVDNTVTEHLRPGSPAGAYTVVWRVTSIDSHTVSGKFSFTANSPSPGQQATATTATTTTSGAAGHASTLWWGAAVLVLVLLLLVAFIIARKPGTIPDDERDPRS